MAGGLANQPHPLRPRRRRPQAPRNSILWGPRPWKPRGPSLPGRLPPPAPRGPPLHPFPRVGPCPHSWTIHQNLVPRVSPWAAPGAPLPLHPETAFELDNTFAQGCVPPGGQPSVPQLPLPIVPGPRHSSMQLPRPLPSPGLTTLQAQARSTPTGPAKAAPSTLRLTSLPPYPTSHPLSKREAPLPPPSLPGVPVARRALDQPARQRRYL